jgi:hypothetical protein
MGGFRGLGVILTNITTYPILFSVMATELANLETTDWIEYDLSELQEDLLPIVTDFSGGRLARNVDNALQLAKLYPIWYEKKKRFLKFYISEDGKYIRVVPDRVRALRKYYYSWVNNLKFPNGRKWVLITLTVGRHYSMQDAWCYINNWVSKFIYRFYNYLRRVKKFTDFQYIWCIEPHRDGYPHVHLLASFPFVPLETIIGWWRDHEGNPICAPHGVDVKFVRDFEQVKSYVVSYLVKGHSSYWSFYREGSKVTVRLSTLWIWYFRVQLLGVSRGLKATLKQQEQGQDGQSNFFLDRSLLYRGLRFIFVGYVSFFSFWKTYFYKFPMADIWEMLYLSGRITEDALHKDNLRIINLVS